MGAVAPKTKQKKNILLYFQPYFFINYSHKYCKINEEEFLVAHDK